MYENKHHVSLAIRLHYCTVLPGVLPIPCDVQQDNLNLQLSYGDQTPISNPYQTYNTVICDLEIQEPFCLSIHNNSELLNVLITLMEQNKIFMSRLLQNENIRFLHMFCRLNVVLVIMLCMILTILLKLFRDASLVLRLEHG